VTGTELFYSFKAGERALAYPFARSISQVLQKRRFPGFDCIVPIPLSPDKIRKGELHRTRELARELGQQLNVPVVQLLLLMKPISKRRILARGQPAGTFRRRYREALSVRPSARMYHRILLLDDVCTHGNTLAEAARKIRTVNEDAAIVAVTVGQMIVKECVLNERSVLKRTS
jgi:competence protein ComFC